MAVNKSNVRPIQPDWLMKTLAGGVLGLAVAFSISGIFAWLGPGGIDAPNKVQFNMWIIAPLWMTVFSLSYLFHSGRQAMICLLASNFILFSVLFTVRG